MKSNVPETKVAVAAACRLLLQILALRVTTIALAALR